MTEYIRLLVTFVVSLPFFDNIKLADSQNIETIQGHVFITLLLIDTGCLARWPNFKLRSIVAGLDRIKFT